MSPEILSQLTVPAAIGLAVASGAALARLSGPVSCTWPDRGQALLRRLNAVKLYRRPGVARTVAGGVLIAALLAGGGLAAYAAAPSAPERLPSEVQGVVGSGDQLSLRLKDAAGGRTIKVGEAYDEGWTLTGLTPTKATLAKDGATREVGLNPTGILAAATAPVAPSIVMVAGLPDQATIDRYMAIGYARFGASFISPEQAADPAHQRAAAYGVMMQEEIDRRQAEIEAGLRTGKPGLNAADERAFLGDVAYDDLMATSRKRVAEMDAEAAADLAARPITGPSSYYLPAGARMGDVQAAAGVDPRGVWSGGPADAQGGMTVTRIANPGTRPPPPPPAN